MITSHITIHSIVLNSPVLSYSRYSLRKNQRSKTTVMSALQESVNQMIKSDTVVIFSKTHCPYCKMAKEAFDKLQKKYKAIELDDREDGKEIQEILGKITGATSVPRVFVKGEFIGGGTDVKKMYESGDLAKKF